MTRSDPAPFLAIQGLSKRFGSFTALDGIDLAIPRGAFVCFLGPSGCGKTTLLRIVAGLDRQDAGRIEMGGVDVSTAPPAERDFGIVFQSYALFPNLTVADNVAYGLVNRRMKRDRVRARVAELLALVGLPDQAAKYPVQLSGGQQQRIALARALATSPSLLLLDEPLSALDAIVPLDTALALVLGANLGSSLNPLLAGREAAGRRVALGNLIVRLLGCVAVLPFLSSSAAGLAAMVGPDRDAVADFHVLFNLALAAAGLPLLRPLSALVRRALPDQALSPTEPPLSLDDGLADTPSIALGLAARHALRMADRLEVMLSDCDRLLSGEDGLQERIRLAGQAIDVRGAEVQRFLAGLDSEALSEAQQRRLAALLSFAVQIGHASDVLARNVAAQIGRRRKRAGRPPPQADPDLTAMLGRLSANLRTAASLLVTEDDALARRLADEKHGFRRLEEKRLASHVASLRGQASVATSRRVVDLDLVRDIKRINDHLVASSAYPILRKRGELLDSRLKPAKP